MPPPPIRRSKPRLGELLVNMGYLSEDQVEGVSAHQRQWGMSFGRAAVARGLCTDTQVVQALARQTGINSIDLEREVQGPEVIGMLPLAAAQEHRAVLLRLDGSALIVAMAAPATFTSQDALRSLIGKSRLNVFLASDVAMDRAICRFYGLPMAVNTHAAQSARDPMLEDPQSAVTSAQPMLTPQVAVMPKPAPPPAARQPIDVSRVEFFELLGLTPRACEMIQRVARSNKVTNREVIARVLDQWAASKAPPGT